MPADPKTLEALESKFGSLSHSEFRDQTRVIVPREQMFEALKFLHEERHFDLLVDITCVDYLNFRDAEARFGLVYLLANTDTNERLTVRVFVEEDETEVPSVVPIWEGANWLEREVWDLFGIKFEGHPDLRRIVLPQEFAAHPLRKDYPLQGRGERHNFPVISRNQG